MQNALNVVQKSALTMLMKKGGIAESDVFAGATKTQPIVLDQTEGLSKKQKITLGKSVLIKQNGTLKMFADRVMSMETDQFHIYLLR